MGQGADKIARSLVELQPTAIVELFLLYFNTIDQPDACVAFHGGGIYNQEITWQGIQYLPIPVETEGFEINANGQMARPKIRVSNKDYFVTDLLIRYNDLQFAKIVRKRTFVKYLDDVNFDGGNPWGQTDTSAEISNDTYVISQKTAENKNYVEFELTSPLDLENYDVNNRLVISRYCFWQYRGLGCRYNGPPIETEEENALGLIPSYYSGWANGNTASDYMWVTGKNYISGEPAFIENKKVILDTTKDAPEYAKIWYVAQQNHTSSSINAPDSNNSYWFKDGCSKKLHSCRKRFQNATNQSVPAASVNFSYNSIDLTSKINTPTNNIAYYASLNGNGFVNAQGYNFVNDGITGNSSKSWIATSTTGTVLLSWPQTYSVKRINYFDNPSSPYSINGAYSYFYTGSSVLNGSALNTAVNTAGLLTTVTVSPARSANAILISGYLSIGASSLSEVEILTSGMGLYNTTFISDQVFQKPEFSIAMWGQFTSGVPKTGKYNLFHCNKNGDRYSGINLYLNCDTQKVVCDYSIIDDIGNLTKENIQQVSVSGDYADIFQGNIFCIVLGNSQYTSVSDQSKMICRNINGTDIFPTQTLRNKNTATNYSGQVFAFRDSRYSGRMSNNLWFGVNNWENTRDIEYISPISISTIGIWEKMIFSTWGSPIYSWFSRSTYNDLGIKAPRLYSEIPNDEIGTNIKNNLYVWWEMDVVSSFGTYLVNNSALPNRPLYISGLAYEYEKSQTVTYNNIINIPQTPKTYLPFGGFPGTDKYGG